MLLLFAICLQTTKTQPNQAKAPVVQSIFISYEPGMVDDPQWIALELRADGTAKSWRYSHKDKGTYSAKGSGRQFQEAARALLAANYRKCESFYGAAVDDIPTITLSAVIDGKRKTIADWGKPLSPQYEKEAPAAIKKLERLLFAMNSKIQWRKGSDSFRAPHYNL